MNEYLLVAWLTIGITGLAVTLWEARIGKTSIELLWKNPELEPILKKITILGIALVESAAIYALIMSLLMIYADGLTLYKALGAGAAITIPGVLAGIGEAMIVVNALKAVQRNPEAEKAVMNNMILFIALVESAAIYGLITGLLILYS